jgi:putative transposase
MSGISNLISACDKPHHLTCVVNQLLPVFSQPQIVRIVMNCWLHQRLHGGMRLYGYVIMEEHLHFLAQAERLDLCLAGFMEQTATQIQEYLVEQQLQRFLLRLTGEQDGAEQRFKFWQTPPEIEQMADDAMIVKTLEYIHINPVKRGYVDYPGQWRYSSARNYAGENGLVEIDRWG